jgi:alcohol dehydrogenase class IV
MILPFSASFTTPRIPQIEFGAGSFSTLATWIPRFGSSLLLVRGRRSFQALPQSGWLTETLRNARVEVHDVVVPGEPGPETVDEAVTRFHTRGIDVVVAIGGGSVIDAGKVIAALLPSGESAWEYLEEVGRGRSFEGPGLPMVAVPTTAGTGSEVTRSAVLSSPGPTGFKRSFRADALIPQVAIVDPDLLATCPRPLIAADGLDAATQLIEALTSIKSNPISDAVAWSGLHASRDGLMRWYDGPAEGNGPARAQAAYAALASGIALAQAGLGAVHGLAAAIGGLRPIPHGVICGALLAPTTAANIAALSSRAPAQPTLARYVEIARVLTASPHGGDGELLDRLVDRLSTWRVHLGIGGLRDYGLTEADIPQVVTLCRAGSMRTNPITLDDEELHEVLERAL